jgi:hypothetical protein
VRPSKSSREIFLYDFDLYDFDAEVAHFARGSGSFGRTPSYAVPRI